MAKAKSGGTRSYLRGRIANDVYSIGKDAKGKKQQVVRSLAESVANPQTIAQMRGRMIMSTVMQAVSAFSPFIDHSFDEVAAGQPSISEFIRRNYALIKADVAANPTGSSNSFGLNKYQEKGVHPGQWLISSGSALLPFAIPVGDSTIFDDISVAVSDASFNAGQLKAALGLGDGNYLTYLGVALRGRIADGVVPHAAWARIKWSGVVDDSTEVTASNVDSCFVIESSAAVKVVFSVGSSELDAGQFTMGIGFSDASATSPHRFDALGLIYTQSDGAGFKHSTSSMYTSYGAAIWNEEKALPTYPVGEQRFLNGGEL